MLLTKRKLRKMKKSLFLCLLLLMIFQLFGNGIGYGGIKADSVYVEIVNDTIKVWDKHIYENCCVAFMHEITVVNDSITIIEKDTSTNYCRCMCYFNLCVTIIGINQGSYRIFVYREYKISDHGHTPDSLYFIDSTSFTYDGNGSGFAATSYQSQCYDPVSVDDNAPEVIKRFELFDCYPNPFNPTTVIHYSLPINSWVTLRVYNVLGQDIATLVDEFQAPGFKSVSWDASGMTSGVYYYKMAAGAFTDVKKLLYLR